MIICSLCYSERKRKNLPSHHPANPLETARVPFREKAFSLRRRWHGEAVTDEV